APHGRGPGRAGNGDLGVRDLVHRLGDLDAAVSRATFHYPVGRGGRAEIAIIHPDRHRHPVAGDLRLHRVRVPHLPREGAAGRGVPLWSVLRRYVIARTAHARPTGGSI